MQYDIRTDIPSLVVITPALVNIFAVWIIYNIFYRGYNDFARLYDIRRQERFLVLQARDRLKFHRIYSVAGE